MSRSKTDLLSLENEVKDISNQLKSFPEYLSVSHDLTLYSSYVKPSNLIPLKICSGKKQVVVLIMSYNFVCRQLFRAAWINQTWINTTKGMRRLYWAYAFVINIQNSNYSLEELTNEHLRFGDMLLLNIPSEAEVKTRALMTALQWLDLSCNYQFMLLLEDHMMLSHLLLYSYLQDRKTFQNELFAGNMQNYKEHMQKDAPPFAEKNIFIMSSDVVTRISLQFDWSVVDIDPEIFIGRMVLKSGINVVQMNTIHDGPASFCHFKINIHIVHHLTGNEHKCVDEFLDFIRNDILEL